MVLIYHPTYSRGGPWFIGMILGYFMYQRYRGKTLRINYALNASLWVLAFSIQIGVILLSFYFVSTQNIPQSVHTSYMVFQRHLWAISICWIIFACQNLKTGGFVRWFLSLPHWQPMARMGLSMYIIHPILQYIQITNWRVSPFMDFWHMVNN